MCVCVCVSAPFVFKLVCESNYTKMLMVQRMRGLSLGKIPAIGLLSNSHPANRWDMSQLFIQLCICVHSSASTSCAHVTRSCCRSPGLPLFACVHASTWSLLRLLIGKSFYFWWRRESISSQTDVSLHEPINADEEQTTSDLINSLALYTHR